jgi:DNA-binding NarL/FixJ family response regulator
VSQQKRKIFLVDDHPLVRDGLANLIHQQSDLVVCGQADDALEALPKIGAIKPDLVVVDIHLPGSSGIELIKSIKNSYPDVLTIALSMYDEKLYAERVIRAGARGYVMKRETSNRMLAAIREVLEGKLGVSEDVAALFMAKFVGGRSPASGSSIELLSDRELEIFRMIGQGLDTRNVADTLHISIKTVQAYCARIKDKLNLANATELLREATLWHESRSH